MSSLASLRTFLRSTSDNHSSQSGSATCSPMSPMRSFPSMDDFSCGASRDGRNCLPALHWVNLPDPLVIVCGKGCSALNASSRRASAARLRFAGNLSWFHTAILRTAQTAGWISSRGLRLTRQGFVSQRKSAMPQITKCRSHFLKDSNDCTVVLRMRQALLRHAAVAQYLSDNLPL